MLAKASAASGDKKTTQTGKLRGNALFNRENELPPEGGASYLYIETQHHFLSCLLQHKNPATHPVGGVLVRLSVSRTCTIAGQPVATPCRLCRLKMR